MGVPNILLYKGKPEIAYHFSEGKSQPDALYATEWKIKTLETRTTLEKIFTKLAINENQKITNAQSETVIDKSERIIRYVQALSLQ